jgi:hypothetical protein
MRGIFLAAPLAITAVALSASASMAQKKQPPPSLAAYKECCEKSNSRFYFWDGKPYCLTPQRFADIWHQCLNARGLRNVQLR